MVGVPMSMGKSCPLLNPKHLDNCLRQIGLGNNIVLDTITVPTEVILWRASSPRSGTKCLCITAGLKLFLNVIIPVDLLGSKGGDLTAFVVERVDESSSRTIDLLMCGNGQWGGLGSNTYSNAQSVPLRAKNVSGLQECKTALFVD